MNPAARLTGKLKRLLDAVIAEAVRSPAFAARLEDALGDGEGIATRRSTKSHRRPPGVVDPFTVFAEAGEDGVRRLLSQLTVEQLKDIVAQHGMDRSKLAMKWKTTDRFVDLIVETVVARSRKGDAFR